MLTLGAQGAALLWRDPSQPGMLQGLHMPAVPAKVVSLSGAGDTLVAGER